MNTIARRDVACLLKTLPICCEAESLFCSLDGPNLSPAELKALAKAHRLNLNADELSSAAALLQTGARLSVFFDWFFHARGGQNAEDIAAVRAGFSRAVTKADALVHQVQLQRVLRGRWQRKVNMPFAELSAVLTTVNRRFCLRGAVSGRLRKRSG
jgi:hypothetical protein